VVNRIVVLRRGRVVAGDIDPKRTSIEEVERIITGISEEAIRNAAASTGA
jgi:simple sugar transport system ATP-binding protein